MDVGIRVPVMTTASIVGEFDHTGSGIRPHASKEKDHRVVPILQMRSVTKACLVGHQSRVVCLDYGLMNVT
jgi:hypothetical protein